MWAFSPLSGQGAAIHGGRFNPKGMPALYLSLSIDTAVTEAAQGFAGKLEPLTICLYEVDCDGIIDLSTPGARDAAGVDLAEMESPWAWDRAEKRKPASPESSPRPLPAWRVPTCATLCSGAGAGTCQIVCMHMIHRDVFRKARCPGMGESSWQTNTGTAASSAFAAS
jgi:hypothetical protein